MSKTSYKYYVAPVYDLNFSNKTVLTAGVSHEVSASLSNAMKLSLGTAITAGLSTSLKFGYDIEFKHPNASKYEIDIDDEQIKDGRAGTTNIYNADQFRVTAGELGPTPANLIKSKFIATGRRQAFYALLFQLAATSLTISTALKANLDASDNDPNVPFWGGGGGQDSGEKYWASWSTVLIEGFSLVSLVLAFVAGRAIDNSKRKTPERHKNFLNMDKNAGIMLGVQSTQTGFGIGSWYLQKQGLIEIGSSESMDFNSALTGVVLDPATRTTKKPARLSLTYRRVLIEGGTGNIVNSVPKGEFVVKVADVANPRLLLDKNNSFVRIPGQAGANYGLEMQSGRVKLSLDAETDLDLGTGGMVKLRKGAGTSLSLKSDAATLAATTINLTGTDVNINGANFKVGKVTLGDLECLVLDVSQSLTQRTVAMADGTARTAKNIAEDAARRAEAVAAQVADVAQQVQAEFEQIKDEFKSETEYLLSQIKRLKR
jgi:hypothetical protein